MTHFTYSSSYWWIFSFCLWFGYWNTAVTMDMKISLRSCFGSFEDTHILMWNCWVLWFLLFLGTTTLVQFSNFSTSSPTFIFSFWRWALLLGMRQFFILVLTCLSLMSYESVKFFHVCWPFGYLFWKNILLSSLATFEPSNCKCYLYIIDINSWLHLQIYFLSLKLPFHSLDCAFQCINFNSFNCASFKFNVVSWLIPWLTVGSLS